LSQFQATLIVKKELRIETFQQLIEKKDIRILMNKNSYAYKIIKRVIGIKFLENFFNKNYQKKIF
jgi:hypothetical protein